MAGGSHVDARLNALGGQALVRDLGLPPSFCPSPAVPYNPIDIGNVQSALLDRLDRWVGNSEEPPASRFMALDMSGPVSIELDADGNAIGGIRTPQVEVPLGTYLPNNSGPGFCFLYGGFAPFSEQELAMRYRNHGSYVSRMVRAVQRSQKEGFLLTEGAAALRALASRSEVGR